MTDSIKIICENLGEPLEVSRGTSLLEVASRLTPGAHPFLAAEVNHRIKELNYRIYTPITVRFIDRTTFAGMRVYQRTVWFMLHRVMQRLYPDAPLHICHSMGRNGFYCEVEGKHAFTEAETAAIDAAMRALADEDLHIERTRLLTSTLRERYAALGYKDKVALLDTRPRLYSDLHTMGDSIGYFYGAMAPSTGYIRHFAIAPYYEGFYLALPTCSAPDTIYRQPRQEKMFGIFREYQSWVRLMGFPTVGDLNARILAGESAGLIQVAEAFHERKFAEVADAIFEAHRTRGTRMVLISGPSSSGKTTSAMRLGIQLAVLGLRPVRISLDDYFVDRDKTPLDKEGKHDFEALEAIDIALFNDHLRRLMAGEQVDIPRYDFISGRRTWHNNTLQLDERSILIVEGIHGLNPKLTPSIPDAWKFRIYISCFTSVAMDNLSRISTTDNRLLRRLVRDASQRGADAVKTLSRWASVRRGEEKHIFPYQEHADVMLNSSLFYEISVLRPYAVKMLREVPDTVPEYAEAHRLLKFLDNFIEMEPTDIPPTSLLREFVGGSTFRY